MSAGGPRQETPNVGKPGTLGWLVRIVAAGYPLALLAAVVAFRLVGERHSWLVTAVLYLPRAGFALPLPILTLVLLIFGPRRWLLSQLVAALILLFPLMGLRVSLARAPTAGAQRLRVVTLNNDTGIFGPKPVVAQVRALDADVIVLQEVHENEYQALRGGLTGYAVATAGQFLIASRFPIEETFEAPAMVQDGIQYQPAFARFRLATPGGPLRVYNLHLASPREALEHARQKPLGGGTPLIVANNAALRVAQLTALVEDARRSPDPVIIAGDTNLPDLSWAFGHHLGDYHDAFAETGTGFGYTFPSQKRTWMRIDRILADARFRFLRCTVIRQRVSNHFAVSADVELPAVRP